MAKPVPRLTVEEKRRIEQVRQRANELGERHNRILKAVASTTLTSVVLPLLVQNWRKP